MNPLAFHVCLSMSLSLHDTIVRVRVCESATSCFDGWVLFPSVSLALS
jgi:hypothetical protein